MMKVIPETRFGFGFERTKRVSGITFIMYVQNQSQNDFLE
jgi:hypothetical protein